MTRSDFDEAIGYAKKGSCTDILLSHVGGIVSSASCDNNKIMPFAVEAAWVTGRWDSLLKFKDRYEGDPNQDFNISIGNMMACLYNKSEASRFSTALREARDKIASAMSDTTTASLQSAHRLLLQCHVLTDLEMIVYSQTRDEDAQKKFMDCLNGRLSVMGANYADKQYLLGIQRAAMELTR